MKPKIADIAQAAIESTYAMLDKHGLTAEAPALTRALQQEIASRVDIVHVTLITPNGKGGTLGKTIKEILEKKLGRPVELIERADKSLLGGAIIEYGDVRIDVSMKGALEQARKQLEDSSPS